MARHVIRKTLEHPPEDVGALLAHPCTDWVEPFLVLSASAAGTYSRPPGDRTWYRVASEHRPDDRHASVDLHWAPHAGHQVFSSFCGRLSVIPDAGDGSVLTVEGDATGGEENSNRAVLAGLLDVIDNAMTARCGAAQSSVG